MKIEVWKIIPRNEVPISKMIVDTKWVFKIKNVDRRYRAHLAARGFLQKEGVYFGEIHSPFLNDMSLRNNWVMVIVDVEAAFLEGNLEEEIYIKIPEGVKYLQTVSEEAVGN